MLARHHARKPQRSWKAPIAAKNTPDGIQSFQCAGDMATWITAAPTEATPAHRAASLLAVLPARRETTH